MISHRSLITATSRRSPLGVLLQFVRLNSNRSGNAIAPSMTKIGIPVKNYIPLQFSHMPSPIIHPIKFMKCIFRRIGQLGLNTLQIVEYRRSLKPNFTLWRNEAIEKYVIVNKAFASKNMQSLRTSCTTFVYDALNARLKTLPKNVDMEWKLLKFNKVPKILIFQNFPAEDGSTLCLQITYKFDTKQRLVTLVDGEAKVQDRDMVEYLSFNVDPYSEEVCLAGSNFESGPDDIMFRGQDHQLPQREVIQSMIVHGDIYRSEPKLQSEDKKSN